MATHSSTLAWKIPRMEEPGRLQSMGSLRVDMTERLHFDFSLSCIGEGTGNPLQYSCLENPREGGAWWAAVYGVAQSRTRLKRLSGSSSLLKACATFGSFMFFASSLSVYVILPSISFLVLINLYRYLFYRFSGALGLYPLSLLCFVDSSGVSKEVSL